MITKIGRLARPTAVQFWFQLLRGYGERVSKAQCLAA